MKIVGIILLACLIAFSDARPDRPRADHQRKEDMEDSLLQLLRQRMLDNDEDEEDENEKDENEHEQSQMKEKEVATKKEKAVSDVKAAKKADSAEEKKTKTDAEKKDVAKDTATKNDARKKFTNDVVNDVLKYMDSKKEFSDEDAMILTKHLFEAISDISQMGNSNEAEE